MDEYLVDTNVLSRIFYGDQKVKDFLDTLSVGIETVVYIECIQGSISESDKNLIKRSLQNLRFYDLSSEISKRAIGLIDKYSNSNGLLLADALIASTALKYDLTLITYNTKDFKFINGLKYLEPKI